VSSFSDFILLKSYSHLTFIFIFYFSSWSDFALHLQTLRRMASGLLKKHSKRNTVNTIFSYSNHNDSKRTSNKREAHRVEIQLCLMLRVSENSQLLRMAYSHSKCTQRKMGEKDCCCLLKGRSFFRKRGETKRKRRWVLESRMSTQRKMKTSSWTWNSKQNREN